MEIVFLVVAGAVVGLIVGITGVGGGALMTPALLMFGFPAHIAIGTDLWFAAITKSGGLIAHHKQNHINWPIALGLAAGSIPAAITTGLVLAFWFNSPENYAALLKLVLGIMLIATSVVIILRSKITRLFHGRTSSESQSKPLVLIGVGACLGTLVTLSSVGAGAIGTAVLMILFPTLLPKKIVGTDIAHAVPLTFIAGAVHLYLGNVNFMLLLALLAGSIPAISIGSRLTSKVPSAVLQRLLATMLMLLGMKYAIF